MTSFTFSSFHSTVVCVTSTKKDGSMKNNGIFDEENIIKFAQKHHVSFKHLVRMNQVHSGNVRVVPDTSSQVLSETDGLITNKKNLFLGVVTADCLPIVFFDPENHVVAAVHAGYKGLLHNIIGHTLNKMGEEFGSKVENIHVSIGPSIQRCCYQVDKNRAREFVHLLPEYPEIVQKKGAALFLDLQLVAKLLLLSCGVSASQIEISSICTKDSQEYFSYRRDGKEKYGEMLTLVGLL